MVRRLLAKPWNTEDVARLKELVGSGATALRAAAALGRPITSVKRKAYDLGLTLASVRKIRADLRQRGAIEERRRRKPAEAIPAGTNPPQDV